MYKKRKLFAELFEHTDKKQITVLTGMRRTGKTTIVKELLNKIDSENKIYFDLERIDNRILFSESNYDNIINALKVKGINFKQKAFIAIDEIQLLKNITSVVKYLYDNFNIKFILTGSSSFYIKNLFNESLAGRKKIFELYPLDFGEFLIFNNISLSKSVFKNTNYSQYNHNEIKNHYEEYINWGGFPEVVLTNSEKDKVDLLDDILNSYINLDIKVLSDFNTDREIYDLIRILAGRIGSKLDYSKLSRICGISRYKLISHIEFFEKTYFINRLYVLSSSPDREIVKAQKLYFCDNGLVNRIARLSSGSIFENAIFNQLKFKGELKYYSQKNGREIDFIINNKEAFEVKETPGENDYKRIKSLSEKLNIKKFNIIGRYTSGTFSDFLWGGFIV